MAMISRLSGHEALQSGTFILRTQPTILQTQPTIPHVGRTTASTCEIRYDHGGAAFPPLPVLGLASLQCSAGSLLVGVNQYHMINAGMPSLHF
eukprot:4863797-Pleurochrysis_carterae.AAC.2